MERKVVRMKRMAKRKVMAAKSFLLESNAGMGTVEIILIIVVIFTIYKGCK